MMCRLQNGDINHRNQVIEQNGKDIPFISIDLLRRFLPILNRYIEKIDMLKFWTYQYFRYIVTHL